MKLQTQVLFLALLVSASEAAESKDKNPVKDCRGSETDYIEQTQFDPSQGGYIQQSRFDPSESSYMDQAQFDPYFNKCFIPLGGPCSGDPKFTCALYSECSRNGHDWECQCMPRFVTSEDGSSCRLAESFNETCDPTKGIFSTCDVGLGLQCNKNGAEGTCVCRDGWIWNDLTSTCIPALAECDKRIGGAFLDANSGRCFLKLNTNGGLTEMKNLMVTCPSSSSPQQWYGQTYRCMCDKGYLRFNGDKSCLLLKTHQESCTLPPTDTICDPNAFLTCLNNTCQCGEPGIWNTKTNMCNNEAFCTRHVKNLFYDDSSQKCMGLIGGIILSEDHLSCPENAVPLSYPHNYGHPGLSSPGIKKMCACRSKFNSSPDQRSCVPI